MTQTENRTPRTPDWLESKMQGVIGGTEPCRKSLHSFTIFCIKKPQPIFCHQLGHLMLKTFALLCELLRLGHHTTYYTPTDYASITHLQFVVK